MGLGEPLDIYGEKQGGVWKYVLRGVKFKILKSASGPIAPFPPCLLCSSPFHASTCRFLSPFKMAIFSVHSRCYTYARGFQIGNSAREQMN